MTFALWLGVAAVIGALTPAFFRSHPYISALAASALPSIALCLYYVSDVVGDAWGAFGLMLVTVSGSTVSLIASGLSLVVIRLGDDSRAK